MMTMIGVMNMKFMMMFWAAKIFSYGKANVKAGEKSENTLKQTGASVQEAGLGWIGGLTKAACSKWSAFKASTEHFILQYTITETSSATFWSPIALVIINAK